MNATIPYAFDGAYARCYANRDMAMDPRHVYTVHDVLRAWPFRNALEIGSWWGASATAFVEAINGGAPMTATFCDIDLTDSLWDVAGNCRHPDRVRLTRDESWKVLESGEDFDFVLLDANHDYTSVIPELKRLCLRRPLCVMAHDTNATDSGYARAEGARLVREVFRQMPGYRCVEDCEARPGEQTHRGLFLAARDATLFRGAISAFDAWRHAQL